MRLCLLLLLAACSKNADPVPQARQARASAESPPPAHRPTRESDIPQWASLDNLDGAPANVTAWKPDATHATLAVFSASWCPSCTASALADRHLAQEHGKDFQIGVALQEANDAFARSPYAKALSGVPVWSEASTKKLVDACHPVAIPSACLFEHGKVLWSGGVSEVAAVLEAHRANKLAAFLAQADSNAEAARAVAREALSDPAKIPTVVTLMHGAADEQNSIAWRLVDRDDPSPNAIALAVALARDAVALDGGLDFAHLDTYALALSRAGRDKDAAYVGMRVIAVCDAVHGNCSEERRRAEQFVAKAP